MDPIIILKIENILDFLQKMQLLQNLNLNLNDILILDLKGCIKENFDKFKIFDSLENLKNYLISKKNVETLIFINTFEYSQNSLKIEKFENLNTLFSKKDILNKNIIYNNNRRILFNALKNCPINFQNTIGFFIFEDNLCIFKCCKDKTGTIIKKYSLNSINNLDYFKILENNLHFKYKFICKSCNNKYCTSLENEKLDNVLVSISKACNLHCNMCGVGPIHKDTQKQKDVYFKILYALKGHSLNSIRLTDEGEPFFYKEETLKYLESLDPEKDFKKVNIISNVILLNEEDIKRLKNVKVKIKITVSVDTLKKEVYEKIRRGGDFEKFINNTKSLIENGLVYDFHMTIQKGLNDNEFETIKKYCEKHHLIFSYENAWIPPWYNYEY